MFFLAGHIFLSAGDNENAMQAKTLIALIAGFGLGIVAAKIVHHFEAPKIVEVPIPERDIPVEGPKVREVQRSPQIHGRREIF